MIQKIALLTALFLMILIGSGQEANACGYEGWYFGGGYTQLFQVSRDKQNVAAGIASSRRVPFANRFGGHLKVGHDWCGTRYGLEATIHYDKQRLNKTDMVHQFGGDLNSVIHLVETPGGLDFYLLAGLGVTLIPKEKTNNSTGAIGGSLNLGPGLRYFLDKKRKAALFVEIPAQATLFFGNNLSARKTSVLGIPLRIGFTVGF